MRHVWNRVTQQLWNPGSMEVGNHGPVLSFLIKTLLA